MNPGVNIGLHVPRTQQLLARPLAKPAPPPSAPAVDPADPDQVLYVGRRDARGAKRVFVVTNGLQRKLPWGPHLPRELQLYAAVLEWGYRGPGPRHLALALLAHAAGPEVALRRHEDLAEKITYQLALRRGWTLTAEQVLAAVGLGAGGAGRAA